MNTSPGLIVSPVHRHGGLHGMIAGAEVVGDGAAAHQPAAGIEQQYTSNHAIPQ